MSFRCQRCGTAYPNNQHPAEKRPFRVIADVRPRMYRGENSVAYGWEIKKEQIICAPCLRDYVPPEVTYNPEDLYVHYSRQERASHL